MKRGALLVAHNNERTDYYKMAVYTAKRINRFLDLPVSIITDHNSVTDATYTFDNTYYIEPDSSNQRKNTTWINKGRYHVYDYSPYDETLVLDTDYMINTQQLLHTFDYSSDFVCHKNTMTLLCSPPQEYLSRYSAQSLWATVMRFRKTARVRDLFSMMQMIQENYQHYSSIHKFQAYMYRNDYALTLALRTVNGHIEQPQDYLHWRLLHIDLKTAVTRNSDTSYRAVRSNTPRSDWVQLSDIDFHMLDKQNYMELINE